MPFITLLSSLPMTTWMGYLKAPHIQNLNTRGVRLTFEIHPPNHRTIRCWRSCGAEENALLLLSGTAYATLWCCIGLYRNLLNLLSVSIVMKKTRLVSSLCCMISNLMTTESDISTYCKSLFLKFKKVHIQRKWTLKGPGMDCSNGDC